MYEIKYESIYVQDENYATSFSPERDVERLVEDIWDDDFNLGYLYEKAEEIVREELDTLNLSDAEKDEICKNYLKLVEKEIKRNYTDSFTFGPDGCEMAHAAMEDAIFNPL